MVKKDIESLFCHSCNIYEYEEYTEGSVTKHREVLKYSDLKCRISYTTGMLFGKLRSGEMKSDALNSKQNIKLFLPNDIKVKAGSKVEVFHQNNKTVFVNSSDSAFYKNHTEVLLESSKEWA